VAQGLAFLFGATPSYGVPVCLRTRLRGVTFLLLTSHHVGFKVSQPKQTLL
jgi:hypothetical protein